ncbi:hypothetical protein Trydic_g23600 [Trypoxylus dichotomus]
MYDTSASRENFNSSFVAPTPPPASAPPSSLDANLNYASARKQNTAESSLPPGRRPRDRRLSSFRDDDGSAAISQATASSSDDAKRSRTERCRTAPKRYDRFMESPSAESRRRREKWDNRESRSM